MTKREKPIYDGSVTDLPEYLPWFKVPVPKGFFGSIFRKSSKSSYVADKFGISRGDSFYDCIEAYTEEWGDALKKIKWTLQIDAAETGFADATIQAIVYEPNKNKTGVERRKEIKTTQAKFMEFLEEGRLVILE